MQVVSIILARGGSKGLPKKNILPFCGKPLIAWSIEQCRAGGLDEIFVSSDSEEILAISEQYGARSILRPKEISDDAASSESGWLHGLEFVEESIGEVDWVFAPQVTSPLRDKFDVSFGIELAKTGKYDSLFSCNVLEDFLIWEEYQGVMTSLNYDFRTRQRRQDMKKTFLENGSFYLFTPEILRNHRNRLGGRIGRAEMSSWKMFEIDSFEDFRQCETIMKAFLGVKND